VTFAFPKPASSLLSFIAVCGIALGVLATARLAVPERASAAGFQRCSADLPTFGLTKKNVTCTRARIFARARRADATSGTYGSFRCRANRSSNVRSWSCTHRATRRAIVWAERLEAEVDEDAPTTASCSGVDAPPIHMLRSFGVPCEAGLRIARQVGATTNEQSHEGLRCRIDAGVGMQEGDRSWSCTDATAGIDRFLTWIHRP
jgi:hypothetical protein